MFITNKEIAKEVLVKIKFLTKKQKDELLELLLNCEETNYWFEE
jgi:hypothetical protein